MKQILIIISLLLLTQSASAKKELRPRVIKKVTSQYQFYDSERSNYEEDDQIDIRTIENNNGSSRRSDNNIVPTKSEPISKPQKTLCDSIIIFAKSQLGKPYKYGTSGPKSFDCSGFTSYVLSHFGLNYGRSSRDQIQHGKHVSIQDAQPGDLIFFTGWRNRSQIGHVGIVYSKSDDEPLSFIHSSTNQGVIVSSLQSGAYYSRFKGIRRVLPEGAFSTPTITEQEQFIADLAVLSGTESLESEEPAPTTTSSDNKPKAKLTPPDRSESAHTPVPKKIEPQTKSTTAESKVETASNTPKPAVATTAVTTTPKEKKPAPASSSPVTHAVKRGDTLSSIAIKYRTTVAKLRQANNIKGDHLSLNQKIKIPK